MKIIDTILKHRQHHEWGWPTTWNVAESYQLGVVEVRDMTITLGRATNRNKCPGRPNSERDSLAFHTLWFVSLNTQRYLPRTFSGSCLNCPIHIPWFLFEWNHICGSRCRNRYHLLKECHEMSRIGWHGSLQNSISDDSIAVADYKFAIALNMPSSGVRIFRPGVTLFRVFTSMIQDTCITSWNLLKLCNCNSMTLKCVLNFFRNVWGRFCFMWDMVVPKPAFGASNSKAIGFPRG